MVMLKKKIFLSALLGTGSAGCFVICHSADSGAVDCLAGHFVVLGQFRWWEDIRAPLPAGCLPINQGGMGRSGA